MEITNHFWSGKKVLITGHTGFKGGWLCLWLEYLGAEILGFSLPPSSKQNLYTSARIGEGIITHFGDIRDFDTFSKVIQEFRPEIIIHLAAQALVRRSYADPKETFSTNVMGVVNLFEAVRKCDSVKVLVNVTTDKCYENIETLNGYKETDRLGGYDPYSSSKACAELVTSAYRRSFFNFNKVSKPRVSIATARAGNVIGGGDWSEDRLAPDVISSILAKKTIVLRNPQAIRPWQHVLDPLSGYLSLAEKMYECGEPYSEAWNFGPNDSENKSVGDLVTAILQSWGDPNLTWVIDSGQNPHEANYLTLNCDKARYKLGYRQSLDFVDMVEYLVDWHKAVEFGCDPREVTINQIESYMKTVGGSGCEF